MKSPRLRTGPGGLYSEGGGGEGKGPLYGEEERLCLCLRHSDPGTGSDFVAQGIPWTLPSEPPHAHSSSPQTTSSGCPSWSDWSRWRSGWQRSQQLGRPPARLLTPLQFRYIHEGTLQ